MAHRRIRQRGGPHRRRDIPQDSAVPPSGETWPQVQVGGSAEGPQEGEPKRTSQTRRDDAGLRRAAGYPGTLGWDDAHDAAQAYGDAYARGELLYNGDMVC